MRRNITPAIWRLSRLALLANLAIGLSACGDSVVAALAGGGTASDSVSLPEIALPKSCSSVEGASLRPRPSAVPAACVAQSWLAGSNELCQGRHIHRDYVYDDYGAETGGISQSAGDDVYPAGAENTADIVNLQLWAEGGRLRVRGELNALFEAGSTVLALAIDTDNNAATGGGAWCDLGVSSTGWDLLQAFRQGDIESNVIEGSIPMPAGSRWRVQAVAAQADGTVMNVAYRGTDESAECKGNSFAQGCYFEDKQAAALGDGDITVFGTSIDVFDLLSGATVAPTAITPGLHSRVYTSAYTIAPGEGTGRVAGRGDGAAAPIAAQFFDFLGKYQPYGIYVPTTAKAPYPLQMVFHGSGQTHVDSISLPGFQRTLGEQFGRLLVAPLARGPDGYGSDISERDILDVMADLEKTYPIDSERIIASGYSQGGYITYRMSMLYPQRFAGFVSWVGFNGEDTNGLGDGTVVSVTAGAVGNMRDFVGNARHVPGAMVVGGADELVHVVSTRDMQQAFAATDNRYHWYLHPAAEHATFNTLDIWDKEAAYSKDFKRVLNPPRVTFRHDPTLGNAAFGIRHDRAYWVSGIVNRTVGADHLAQVYGDLDLSNRSCGGSVPVTATANNAGPSPVPWVSEERNATGANTPVNAENLLEGTLTNIAALTLDAAATCNAGKPLRYAITTDGPAEIRLSDGRSIELPAAGQHQGQI